MMKCLYCEYSDYEMYLVRKAIKPKYKPNRWVKLGHCCEKCFKQGRETTVDPWHHVN